MLPSSTASVSSICLEELIPDMNILEPASSASLALCRLPNISPTAHALPAVLFYSDLIWSNIVTFCVHLFLQSSRAMVGIPRWLHGEEPACQGRRCRRSRSNPWVGKIPWSRKWQLALVFLPGKSHGQRSLAGYQSMRSQRVRYN